MISAATVLICPLLKGMLPIQKNSGDQKLPGKLLHSCGLCEEGKKAKRCGRNICRSSFLVCKNKPPGSDTVRKALCFMAKYYNFLNFKAICTIKLLHKHIISNEVQIGKGIPQSIVSPKHCMESTKVVCPTPLLSHNQATTDYQT